MSEKLCVFCEHMNFCDGGTGEYADPASMECAEGHWRGFNKAKHPNSIWGQMSEVMLYSLDDFREVILMAKDCNDYKPPKAKP